MTLQLIHMHDERLVAPEVVALLRRSLAARGSAVLLAPSLAVALRAQRELAAQPGLAMGVACTTPDAWASLRWDLYGDGRAMVTPPVRAVLMSRLLERGDVSPLDAGDGTVEVLCQLSARGLPWLPAGEAVDGLSAGERRALELARDYGELLRERGLVEPCEALASLPGLMREQGAELAAFVMVGFGQMPRATREFALAVAEGSDLALFVADGVGPAGELAARAQAELAAAAHARGIAVEDVPAEAPDAAVVADGVSAAAGRAPELQYLVDTLFRPDEAMPLEPGGAVRLLEPAGPLAVDELVCRHVLGLAGKGALRVVVVAPDVAAAWRTLAPKLQARGLAVRAQLSMPAARTRVAAGLMRFAGAVAHLVELEQAWPDAASDELPDMGWWPPREVSDFLLSRVGAAPHAVAWRRDAAWRGNRILTPVGVLATLSNPQATSPAIASAVRELLKGHVAAAAGRLVAVREGAGRGDANRASAQDGASPAGAAPVASASASAEGDAQPSSDPSAEAALAAAEDEGALVAVAEAGRALRDAGVALGEDGVTLARLVELAQAALGRLRVTLRPELVGAESAGAEPAGTCTVELMSPATAASLAPCSADALVYLGLDAASSPIPASDGALDELLDHLGIDRPTPGLARVRAGFSAALRAATGQVALVRLARDASAAETFPAVMLSEVVACYGTEPDGKGGERPRLRPDASSARDEGLIEENLSATGQAPAGRLASGPAPAGGLDSALRRLVVVPRDGQAELPEGRPSLSASQIESYLECPYKWFTLRRLGLDDCDAGFTNMEMGTFAHRVLEVTHRQLFLEASRRAGLVGEDAEGEPEGSLFWFDPATRVEGSRVDAQTLAHATELLRDEFTLHLAHQRADGTTRSKQALVPHGRTEQRRLAELERDLETTLAYESNLFRGFEPRLFEGRFGGSSGLAATYAGADLVGTIDRIDVDGEGRALVIDYKHKSALFDEYALSPRGDSEERTEFLLPRRVQTLVYASVARRLLKGTGVTLVGAVYLGTKGRHEVAGAVSVRDVESVWGAGGLSERRAARVTVPVPGARSFDDLLDRTEERIAEAIGRMRAGEIDARPIAPDACAWCPVLDCERRLS